MLTIALPLQVALGCVMTPPATPPDVVAAVTALCMQDLQRPNWQKHDLAIGVLAGQGKASRSALRSCVMTEPDDAVRSRCVRALGMQDSDEASQILLAALAQSNLKEDTVSALASACAAKGLSAALPLLSRFVLADDVASHSAAIAMFQLDPHYYVKLPTEQQVAYAVGVADTPFLKTHRPHAEAFSATAGSLAEILVTHLRSGRVTLAGREVLMIRWLHLFGQLGSAVHAKEILDIALFEGSDAARTSVLELLSQWQSPLGIPLAVEILRDALSQQTFAHASVTAQAGRYLRRMSAAKNAEARAALTALWKQSGTQPSSGSAVGTVGSWNIPDRVRKGVRCQLVWSYRSMTPTPAAIEVAELLDSPCAHDLTILLNIPDRQLIDGLIAFLRFPPPDPELFSAARTALAWQCGRRLTQPMCRRAAWYLRGGPLPSHPD